MIQRHKGLNKRDGFLFCSVVPEESGLEKNLWFDCLGKDKNCEPCYLEGKNLQTAKTIPLKEAQLNPYLKKPVFLHRNHEITDTTLLSEFVSFCKCESKEKKRK